MRVSSSTFGCGDEWISSIYGIERGAAGTMMGVSGLGI